MRRGPGRLRRLAAWLCAPEDQDPALCAAAEEVGEEVEFHLEMLTRRCVAQGMDEARARAAARERFGNPAAIRRRSVWVLTGERRMLTKLNTALTGALLLTVVGVGAQVVISQGAQAEAVHEIGQKLSGERADGASAQGRPEFVYVQFDGGRVFPEGVEWPVAEPVKLPASGTMTLEALLDQLGVFWQRRGHTEPRIFVRREVAGEQMEVGNFRPTQFLQRKEAFLLLPNDIVELQSAMAVSEEAGDRFFDALGEARTWRDDPVETILVARVSKSKSGTKVEGVPFAWREGAGVGEMLRIAGIERSETSVVHVHNARIPGWPRLHPGVSTSPDIIAFGATVEQIDKTLTGGSQLQVYMEDRASFAERKRSTKLVWLRLPGDQTLWPIAWSSLEHYSSVPSINVRDLLTIWSLLRLVETVAVGERDEHGAVTVREEFTAAELQPASIDLTNPDDEMQIRPGDVVEIRAWKDGVVIE